MAPSLPAVHSTRPALLTWLFVSVCGATIAAVFVCTLLTDRFLRDEAARDATLYLQTHADALRDALDRGMGQNYEQIRVLGQLDQVALGTDPAVIRRALDQMHASFPQYAWLGLAGLDGKVIAGTDGLLQGSSVAARPWFAGARDGMFVGDVHRALLLEQLLPAQAEPWRFVDVATPVLAADGSLRGVLAAHLSWAWAADIKRDLVDTALAKHQAEALIVGTDGTVLLGSAALQGRKLPPVHAGELSVESRTQGAGRFPGLGWNVVLRQPESVAMADLREVQTRARLAAVLLCLAFAPLLWVLSRRLAKPLRELGAQMLAGDIDPAPLRGNPLYREADLLGQALDRYAQRHRDDAVRLRELNASLEARVVERTAALARTNEELERAVRERSSSERRLRTVTDNMPALVSHIDADLRYSYANATYRRWFDIDEKQMVGRTVRDVVGDVAFASVSAQMRAVLAGESLSFEAAIVVNGRSMHNLIHYIPDIDERGVVQGIYGMVLDLTARRDAELAQARSEQRLRTITDNLPVLISYIDKDERYQFCNGTYGTWLGLDPNQVVGRTMQELLGAEEYGKRRHQLRRTLAGDRSDFDIESTWLGVHRHLRSTYVPDVVDGRVAGAYVLVSDVTATKEAEAKLERQARTDVLTGLANRYAFNEKLVEALARCRRNAMPIALLFLDIDKFKRINDTLGHAAGDEVLRIFAQRLVASVRETDTVARLAGDEFVVIAERLHTAAESQLIARKIVAAMAAPFEVDGRLLDISASIGIAFHADGHTQPSELLALADKALYEAKDGGRNTFRMAAA